MRISIILFVAVLMAQQKQQSQHAAYDLKGDYLGESLTVFRQRHPKVECYDFNDVTVECKDKNGSFAGHQPFYCEKSCMMNGLTAAFFKGRLSFVNYTVSFTEDNDNDVIQLLTDKYGKPKDHYDSGRLANASWSKGNEILKASVTKSEQIGRQEISVTLEYVKGPEAGDI